MNKYNKKIICMFVFAMIVFPSVIKAESFQYNLKAVVDGANSKIKDTAKYCYTYGCRSGNMGVKISIYNGNTLKTIESSEEVGKDASSNIRIAGVVSNIEDGFNDLATKINKQPTNTDTIEFNDFCNFLNQNDPVLGYGLIHTYQYRVLSSYWSKFRIEQNAINNCDLSSGKFDIKKDNFSRGVGEPPTHDNYIKYFERRNPYIVMEPMISITVSDKENQKASKAFSTFGIDALPDKIMERIKSVSNGKANANTDNISNFMAKTFCNFGGAEQTSCQAITDLYESATPQDLDKLASAWNTVVENFHTEGTKQTKTVKEWAEWIMTGTNYKYVGANSDGTLSSEASKLGGSVTSWIKDISWYFHLGENIGPFTKVSSKATSWKSIVGMTNGYGIIVLKVSINSYDDSEYKCRYLNNGEIRPPIGKEKKDCCEETDIWSDYDVKTGKSGYWQKFYNQTDASKDRYIDICPVEIKDNYCVWNGNKTERYQTVNGKELDCCIYENWGNTNSERQTALKNIDKNNKVTKIVFENSDWYKYNAKCKVIVEEKCTIDKLLSGNHKECCEDINNWPISIKNTIREYGATTLKEYLIGRLGNDVYLSKCPINGCSYEITGQCPSCDDDLTNTGSIKDIVNGADSTELNISDETYKCIKNKASYLGSNDYLAISNSYCKVYCTEKIEYNFPKRSTLNVEAGRKLIVGGNLSPLETKSTVTCRIDKVDVDKFKSDINNLKVKLENAYREYAKSFYPESDKINEHKNYSSCSCIYKTQNFNCCKEETYTTFSRSRKTGTVVSYEFDWDHIIPASSCSWAYYTNGDYKDTCEPEGIYCDDWNYIDARSFYAGVGSKCHKPSKKPLSDPYCRDGSYTYIDGQCVKYVCNGGMEVTTYVDATKVSEETDSSTGIVEYTFKCAEYEDIEEYTFKTTDKYGYKDACAVKECQKPACRKPDNTKYSAYDTVSYDFFKVDNKNSEKYREGLKCATESNSAPLVPIYDSRRESALARLNSIKAEYNAKVQEIEDCGNFYTSEKTKPTYEIELLLDYQNANYSVNTKLSSSRTEERVDNFVNKTSIEVPTFNFNSYSWPKTLTFSTRTLNFDFDINKTQATKTAYTYTYSLSKYDNNAYLYTNKSSVSEKQRSEVNSVYIGPHLPVAYNEKDNKIEVELTPVVVNNNIRKPRSGFENKLCIDPYKCDSVTPGKTKIVPVYRVIALDSPFPDEDGNGRLTGRNWCSGSDCSNTNAVVQKVITNNRGVNENEVYKLTPLYTLVLTPSTVKKIREYNSQTSYGDYNLICEKDTGKYCKSLYLRGEPDKEGNIIDNNLDQMGVLIRDKSCALNENLSGCMFGDYYERGA